MVEPTNEKVTAMRQKELPVTLCGPSLRPYRSATRTLAPNGLREITPRVPEGDIQSAVLNPIDFRVVRDLPGGVATETKSPHERPGYYNGGLRNTLTRVKN
jgi:hypothetical protein